jgi:hypothetical protein
MDGHEPPTPPTARKADGQPSLEAPAMNHSRGAEAEGLGAIPSEESRPAFSRGRPAVADRDRAESRMEPPNLVPRRTSSPALEAGTDLRRRPQPAPAAVAAKAQRRFTNLRALISAWLTVLAVVALAFTLYWQRDRLRAWFEAGPNAAAQQQITSSQPKIADRIALAQQDSQAASAQSASLYEEDSANQQTKRYVGSVSGKPRWPRRKESRPSLRSAPSSRSRSLA